MSPLPSPEIQAADTLDRFRAWWVREGLQDLVTAFSDRLDADQIRAVAEAAYCQGQIDGAEREARIIQEIFLEVFDLDACRSCRALLPPNPAPEDPVVAELGQICKSCLTDQAEARDLLE